MHIESEPGSGKADVARALHDVAGHHDAPYIEMNCAQLLPKEHVRHLFDAGGAIDKPMAAHYSSIISNS